MDRKEEKKYGKVEGLSNFDKVKERLPNKGIMNGD